MASSTKKPVSLAASALACFIPSSSLQAEDDEKVYAEVGGWTVTEAFGETCRLTAPAMDGAELTVIKGGSESGYVRLKALGSSRPERPGRVTFAFDDKTVPGSLIVGTDYAPGPFEVAIDHFRSANTMEVRVDGKVRYSVSLKGSAAGYRALEECASRWPESRVPFVPPPPPPPPPSFVAWPDVPDPVLSIRLPANRNPAPIKPDLWFLPGDVRIYSDFTGSSTVGVVITVSYKGEPAQCEVTEPSDHEELNSRICELIQDRAKFDPATNDQGTPILSRYSTKITF